MIDASTIRSIEFHRLQNGAYVTDLLQKITSIENDEHRDEALIELTEKLLDHLELDLAVQSATLVKYIPGDKAKLFAVIGEAFVRDGRPSDARELFRMAIATAEEVDVCWERAEALMKIARFLAQAGYIERAEEVLRRAAENAYEGQAEASRQNALDASSVLGEIAEDYATMGLTRKGFALAWKVRDRVYRLRTIANIGRLKFRQIVD